MQDCGRMLSKTHGLTFIIIRIQVDFAVLISLKIEAQTVIAKSLGLKMKNSIKADAVPTIFKIGPPQTKKSRRDGDSDNGTFDTSEVKSNPPRGAYRKREAARVSLETILWYRRYHYRKY